MKGKITKITLFGLGILLVLSFGAFSINEFQARQRALMESYQIYPVPIPPKLEFAGEAVPLYQFDMKERLDRELLVNTYWQSNTMLILKRSKKYFQIIEPILKSYGIPDDFKYLAVIESGFQNVTSPSGAKGVWQLMSATAKSYGLEVSESVDERLHLGKSTEAACKYILEAYERFDNWTLSAAAYNRGMNGMQRDMDKQGVNSYYDLHLNSETARYMPRVLAFKAIMEDPAAYGFQIAKKDYYSFNKSYEIKLDSSIANLTVYAKSIGTSYHVLKTLNPWILGNEIALNNKSYTIKVPD